MRKGQGNFVIVVSDISEGNLIEMIDYHRLDGVHLTLANMSQKG
jgi:hypothetical protein